MEDPGETEDLSDDPAHTGPDSVDTSDTRRPAIGISADFRSSPFPSIQQCGGGSLLNSRLFVGVEENL